MVKGKRYGNLDNRAAENCPTTHSSNPLKGSWGLRKLVVTGTQENKSTVKTVLHNKIIIIITSKFKIGLIKQEIYCLA